jgi:hypothetical protein
MVNPLEVDWPPDLHDFHLSEFLSYDHCATLFAFLHQYVTVSEEVAHLILNMSLYQALEGEYFLRFSYLL